MTEDNLEKQDHNSEVKPNHQKNLAIETRRLTKNYGDLVAVDSVSISVPHGITYGLLGPNGAGKTTVVRILAGLIRKTSGDGYILGHPIGRSMRKHIGYMPQELALYTELSVMDNIELYGRLQGMNKAQIREKATELLRLVNLSGQEGKLISTLSGGMKRKVSLICSLIHSPKLLILDEPTVGVDPTLRASLWSYFNAINRSGSTIILTTHYMDEAMHSQIVGFINSGKLIAEDKPANILRTTRTESLEDAFIFLSSEEKAL